MAYPRALLSFFFLLTLTVSSLVAQDGASAAARKYGIRSGVLTWKTTTYFYEEYVLTTTLTFTDHGARQRAVTVAEWTADGVVKRDTQVVIVRDGWAHIWNPGESDGRKKEGTDIRVGMEADQGDGVAAKFSITVANFTGNFDGRDLPLDQLPDSVLKQIDSRPDTMAGRACTLYTIVEEDVVMRNASWSGLPLVFEMERGGTMMISVRATSLIENVEPEAALFALPSRVVFFME